MSLGAWFWWQLRGRKAAAGVPDADERPALAVAEASPEPPRRQGVLAFPCSECGHPLKVKETLAGKKVKCPQCGQAVPVPHTEAG